MLGILSVALALGSATGQAQAEDEANHSSYPFVHFDSTNALVFENAGGQEPGRHHFNLVRTGPTNDYLLDRRISIPLKSPAGRQLLLEKSSDLIQWMPLTSVTNQTGLTFLTLPSEELGPHQFFRIKP